MKDRGETGFGDAGVREAQLLQGEMRRSTREAQKGAENRKSHNQSRPSEGQPVDRDALIGPRISSTFPIAALVGR